MSARSFLDTNILIYAEARDERAKQKRALALLKTHFTAGTGVVSTQVLQEYCNAALKKLKLPASHVRTQLGIYQQFEVMHVTPTIINAGLDLHQTRALSFYDAIIVASAVAAGCGTLYTEDMNDAENIAGLTLVNPFKK